MEHGRILQRDLVQSQVGDAALRLDHALRYLLIAQRSEVPPRVVGGYWKAATGLEPVQQRIAAARVQLTVTHDANIDRRLGHVDRRQARLVRAVAVARAAG